MVSYYLEEKTRASELIPWHIYYITSDIMKLRTWAILLLTMITLSSCEYARVGAGGTPETEYHKTLQSLTKYERLFGLDKTLYETYITYYSPELSQQYVNEYAKIYSLPDAQKNTMLNAEANDANQYDVFMIGHYASENDNQRLNTTDPQKIVWRFYLKNADGTQVESLEIKPVTLGTQMNYFYPYLNAWSRLYRVKFPKTQSSTKNLVMKGPIRELTFVWK